MSQTNRIRRLLRIVAILHSGRAVNAPDLARDCKVSRRTIFRDIENLRDSGLRISYDDKKQTYRFENSRFLIPADLTAEEILALLVLCQDLANSDSGIPYLGPARMAAFKLASRLPKEVRQTVGELMELHHLHLPAKASLDQSEKLYEQIQTSLKTRHPLLIEYNSFTDQKVLRTRLNPYALYFGNRSWYVIGYASQFRQVRTFHLKRFLNAELLPRQTYNIPERFSLEKYFGNVWHMIRDKSQKHHVIIRFGKTVAGNVAEVLWHKTQKIDYFDDGTIDFHVEVEGLKEICWWILGYGNQAYVVQPPELRNMIVNHAQQMIEQYENNPPT